MDEDSSNINPDAAAAGNAGPARSLWMRAALMILMAMAYYVSGFLLFIVAVTQFCFALLAGKPSAHLLVFSRSLGLYYRQNVEFLTFVSDDVPFPFNPWP